MAPDHSASQSTAPAGISTRTRPDSSTSWSTGARRGRSWRAKTAAAFAPPKADEVETAIVGAGGSIGAGRAGQSGASSRGAGGCQPVCKASTTTTASTAPAAPRV